MVKRAGPHPLLLQNWAPGDWHFNNSIQTNARLHTSPTVLKQAVKNGTEDKTAAKLERNGTGTKKKKKKKEKNTGKETNWGRKNTRNNTNAGIEEKIGTAKKLKQNLKKKKQSKHR